MSVYWPPAPQHDLAARVLEWIQAEHYGRPEDPHGDAAREHTAEQVALAARDLVCAVDNLPNDRQPIGWSKNDDSASDQAPLVVSRFDVPMEPAPGEEQVLTIGAVAEDGRPVALLLDPEDRAKVARWLGPEETHVVADDSDDSEHIDDCPGCEYHPGDPQCACSEAAGATA